MPGPCHIISIAKVSNIECDAQSLWCTVGWFWCIVWWFWYIVWWVISVVGHVVGQSVVGALCGESRHGG